MNKVFQKCNVCKKEMLLCRENFQVRRNYSNGFDVACKVCRRARYKKHVDAKKKNPSRLNYKKEKIQTDLCMQYDNSIYC